MSLSASFIARLEDDSERIAALCYLAESAERYPPGLFTPPLERPKNDDKDKPFAALTFHAEKWGDAGTARIIAVEVCTVDTVLRCFPVDDGALAEWLCHEVLATKRTGILYVCNGGRVGILDTLLQTAGPYLVQRSYRLEPALGQHGISWIKVRKGKRSWTITTAETLAGVPLATLLDFAQTVSSCADGSTGPSETLYDAIAAYSDLLRRCFGTALRPTVGMIAASCARRFLPESRLKWRPNPLLIAMERVGLGYRGGIAYGSRFRGDVHRIDVNRQYTALLRMELPCDAVFSKWKGASDVRLGVFVCTIDSDIPLVYPVGLWQPSERRFRYDSVPRGRSVCVLHTSEFSGLYAKGVRIEPGYGYAYSSTFNLASYVDRLEAVTGEYGRNSPAGILMKPLGNMVYGKFGQRPDRWQLCYSLDRPDDTWFPYFNDAGEDIVGVWEREQVRYTSGMHVDIAAHITGAARSQLLQTWALLESYGYHVVRAHTDSITTTRDPREVLRTDAEAFGAWKYEGHWPDGIIVGANSYSLDSIGHIAGIPDVDRSVLEALHADGLAHVSRVQNAPRQGWTRGERVVTRTLTG